MMHKKQFIFVALILINSPLVFALPLQYHPASEVTPGTFDAGNYTFQKSLIVTDLICIGTNCINVWPSGGGGGADWSTYTATSNVNLGGKYNVTNSWGGRGVVGTSSTADGVAGITYAAGKSAVYGWANNTNAYSGYFEGGKGFIVDGDVGIGTPSPSTRLEVLGTLNVTGGSATVQGLYVDPSGNVGVGARNIPYKFAVVRDDGYSNGEHYIATFTNYVGGTGIVLGYRGDGSDWAGSAGLVRATNNRPLVLGTSGTTQAMTVLDNGNVGIGTTGPIDKLHVAGGIRSSGSAADYNNGDQLTLDYNSGTARINVRNAGSTGVLTFLTNSAERMRIDSSGNVGIGTTNPGTSRLKISPVGANTIGLDIAAAVGGSLVDIVKIQDTLQTGSDLLHLVGDSDGDAGGPYNTVFTSGGNVGIGTTTPSTKLEVAGQVKITGGLPGPNKVLTSDASGLATWQTPTASKVYDSGWFSVTTGTSYVKTHNLGTTKVIAKLYFSSASDGSANLVEVVPNLAQDLGAFIQDLTTTQVTVYTDETRVAFKQLNTYFTSGYYRIIILALE